MAARTTASFLRRPSMGWTPWRQRRPGGYGGGLYAKRALLQPSDEGQAMGWDVEESYQKPALLRREQLSKVTAGPSRRTLSTGRKTSNSRL